MWSLQGVRIHPACPTHTNLQISPLDPASGFSHFLPSVWQTTSDHSDISTVAFPQTDSPLSDLPDLKNAAMSAASFAASSSPSPALMAVVACAEIAIDILSGFYFCSRYLSAKVDPFIEADPVIQSVLPSLSERPPPPFWPRRENPGDRSAALPSWDVRGEAGRRNGGGAVLIVREGGGKRGGEEAWGRRAIPFRGVGGGGISWDSV